MPYGDKKKVLYVITKSVWGGAQRYVFDLATNLPKEKFEAVVVTGGEDTLVEKLRKADIRTIPLENLQKKTGTFSVLFDLVNLRLLWHLIKIFKIERPDVIHLNSSKAGGIGALAACILKRLNVLAFKPLVVFTVHGWPHKENRSILAKFFIWLLSWLSSLFQDKIILINTADFETAKKFIPRRKLVLIHNGIQEIDFLTRKESRRFFAKKFGRPLDEKTIVIGTIAALTDTKNKGLPFLINAFCRLNAEDPAERYILSIMGGEDGYEKLQKEIKSMGLEKIILFLGYVPDASRYLKGLDIFVLPSLKEGLPYAIMEAMLAGLPIVASRVGGIPDLIEHKKNGYLVEPKNAVLLSEAIKELLKDRKTRFALGKTAAEKIKRSFTFQEMIEKTSALYL